MKKAANEEYDDPKRLKQDLLREVAERKRLEAELTKYRNQIEELAKERTVELNDTNLQLQNAIAKANQMATEAELNSMQLKNTIKKQKLTEKRLQAANIELKEAKNTAETAARAKSEFLANMSHEIRTPLNAIIGMTYVVLSGELTLKQKNYLNIVHSSSRSLLSLVNDILDFSKIEAGKLELEVIPFKLKEIMNEIVDMVYVKIQEKEIELIIDIAGDVPVKLVSDPVRLRQVILNLVVNAFKFTDKGGEILISVQTRAIKQDKVDLLFCVKDTGTGIDLKQIEGNDSNKLFDLFAQADSSTTRKYGGTGLGLAICKNIVDLMGGEIWVESEPGRGSSFYFGVEWGHIKEEPDNKFSVPQALEGFKVLIVDDNPHALSVVKRYVEAFGFQVVALDRAESVLNVFENVREEDPFDLLIIDAKLSGADGIVLAREVRKKMRSGTPPIIIMSPFNHETEMQRAKDADIEGFITKPVKQSALFNNIMEVFDYGSVVSEQISSNFIDTESFYGTEILLVEDNPINQMVAMEIMNKAGINVDKASGGREAIELIKEKTYDAVLMDIQMPEIDGLETTRIIRKERLDKGQTSEIPRLPVIAMTANAMPGDRERCLEADMDDYIPKPIEPKQLFSTLLKWIKSSPRRKHREAVAEKIKIQPAGNDSLIEFPALFPGIDLVAGLKRINNNKELFLNILKSFYDNNKTTVGEIKKALSKDDREQVKILVHTIKGVAGNISAVKLHQAAKELESGIINQISELDNLFATFEEAVDEVLKSIEKCYDLGKNHDDNECLVSEEDTTIGLEDLKPILSNLAQLLEENSFKAGQYLKSIKGNFDQNLREKFSRIEDYIDLLDFSSAKSELDKVMSSLGI